MIPPKGHVRTLALATLANTIGSGLWLAGGALFLTRSVGLSAASVGIGLTVAGLIGLLASVPLGHLADQRDPRTVRALLQILQAAVAASYLLVQSFPAFLLVAVLDALLTTGNLTVRAALVALVAGPEGRVRAFATLHAVAAGGIGAGAAIAGLALAADTRTAYAFLIAGNALTYLVSAGLLMRLPQFPAPAASGATTPWRALRDRPFLAVSAASAILSLHRVVLALIVPLWIVSHTDAPPAVVSAVLVTNMVLSVFLAVRISRGAQTAIPAARAMRRAGIVLALALLLYAAAAGPPTGVAVCLLLIATAVYTVGDLLHATASAGLSYDLAQPQALGQYQGANGLVSGLAQAVAPAMLTLVLLGGAGWVGWGVLGALFVGAGLASLPLARWALRQADRRQPGTGSL